MLLLLLRLALLASSQDGLRTTGGLRDLTVRELDLSFECDITGKFIPRLVVTHGPGLGNPMVTVSIRVSIRAMMIWLRLGLVLAD